MRYGRFHAPADDVSRLWPPGPLAVQQVHRHDGSSGPVAVPVGLVTCRALLAYDGAAREVIARLKYRNARAVLAWLVDGMARLVRAGDGVVVVTWAPTTVRRRRARGFDQAELLARHLAARLGIGCRPLLTRVHGPPQTGRSHAARRTGPRFEARPSAMRRVGPGAVLLVDDVVTTGATMSAAGTVLVAAGCDRVIGIAAAHTAAPASSSSAA